MLATILLPIDIILKKELKMDKKIFEKNNDKKMIIVFEKLTVREETNVRGGGAQGSACEKPADSDCAFNQ
jgi:hypothetical protein